MVFESKWTAGGGGMAGSVTADWLTINSTCLDTDSAAAADATAHDGWDLLKLESVANPVRT